MRMRLVMVALGLALLCAAPARAASITLELVPDTGTGVAGVSIGIVDAVDLFSYVMNVTFSSPVSNIEALEGDFLARGGTTDSCLGCLGSDGFSITLASFLVNPGGPDPLPGVSGSGSLFSLSFLLSDPGTVIGLDVISLSDSLGNEIAFDGLPPPVSPAPVPEPATVLLMGIGAAGVARRQWRTRRQVIVTDRVS
jgi:PEP-CTERM motif